MWSILLGLLLILITLLGLLDTKMPKNFPPGPKWLPLIGCALEMRRLHKKHGTLSKAFYELSLKYGPVTGLRVGQRKIVLVHGPKATHELFTRDELNGRADDLSATSRTWGKRLGFLFNDSDECKSQRLYVVQQFRKCGLRRQDLAKNLDSRMHEIVDDIKEKMLEDRVIRMDNLFPPHIAKTVWVLLLGERFAIPQKQMEEFKNAMKNFSQKISVTGGLFTMMPLLARICPDSSGYTNYVNVHNRLTDCIRKILKNHTETYDQDNCCGLIDEYWKILSASEKTNGFSKDQLVAICLDLVIGVYETSASIINFAFTYLLLHPDVKKRAQEEIDRVVGRDRLPTLADKPRLPYVDCIVLETIRLVSGRSLVLPRRALTDTFINGYFIPKGTTLIGNFRGIHLTEDAGWENPKAFIPERLMKDAGLVVPENFLPFGSGKRRCLGEMLGRANLFLIVACVLHVFDLGIVSDSPPSTEYTEHFLPEVKPFKMTFTLR